MNARPPIADVHAPQAPVTQVRPEQTHAVSEDLLITGKPLFDTVSKQCSALTTKAYSTSFSLGIRMLHRDLREPIQAIYGFVRFADEIVDTSTTSTRPTCSTVSSGTPTSPFRSGFH